MKKSIITQKIINTFKNYLTENEKAVATIQKYMQDIRFFADKTVFFDTAVCFIF